MGIRKIVYWQVLPVVDVDKKKQVWRWFVGMRVSRTSTVLAQSQADFETEAQAIAAAVKFIRDLKDYPVKQLALVLTEN